MRLTERALPRGLPIGLSLFADDGKILNGAPGFQVTLSDGLQDLTHDLETESNLQMALQKLIALPGKGEVVSEDDIARLEQYNIPMAGVLKMTPHAVHKWWELLWAMKAIKSSRLAD